MRWKFYSFVVIGFFLLIVPSSFAIQIGETVSRRNFVDRGAATVAASSGLLCAVEGFRAPSYAADEKSKVVTNNKLESAIQSDLESKVAVRWNIEPSLTTKTTTPLFPRYGTSSLATSRRSPVASHPPVPFPSWLTGTWLVKYQFAQASFPQGEKVLSLRVPGAGLGTCLSLPNVGYNPPPFTIRFQEGRTVDGAFEDLAYTVPRRFESFWNQAKVNSIRTGGSTYYYDGKQEESDTITPPCYLTGEGCSPTENPNLHSPSTRVIIEYDGPTRSGGRRTQTIDATVIEGVSVVPASSDNTSILVSRKYVQYNVQQELQTYYKEIFSLTQKSVDSEAWSRIDERQVEGVVRVAAFLPYGESRLLGNANPEVGNAPNYDEETALAIYDYKVTMKGITEGDASGI